MILITVFSSLLVAVTVVIHYQALYLLTKFLPKNHIRHSTRIIGGVIGALLAHVIEVIVFGFAYFLLHHMQGFGTLVGNFEGTLRDAIYFSFTSYTTVGFGDIEPLGALRILVGIEALTGLVLITWSASFLFLSMQRHWRLD